VNNISSLNYRRREMTTGLISLVMIGVLANYSGKLVEKIKLPSLIGIVVGEIMKEIAILSVLITAPIGAIGINLSADKILKNMMNKIK
jgi:hypothetical protein